MRLPDFLILGAQRSGTTTLYSVIKAHRQVFMPETKELEFFSRKSTKDHQSLVKYSSTFEKAKESKRIGEASPSYFWVSDEHAEWLDRPPGFETDIPGRVRTTLGCNTKFIICLRNPVDRAISAYVHHLRMGRLHSSKSIREVGDRAGIVHIGFYGAHLERWLESFELENFAILLFEELTADFNGVTSKIWEHLGIRPMGMKRRLQIDRNEAPYYFRDSRGIFADIAGRRRFVASDSDVMWLREIYFEDIDRLARTVSRPEIGGTWLANT